MTRRAPSAAAIAALLLCLSSCASVPAPPASPPVAIGAQLYTVRESMARDPDATLRAVGAMGYDEVEFAGLFGKSPEHFRALLAELHLRPVASHIDWQQFRDHPEVAIDETRRLGAPWLVLAWLPPEQRASLAQWRGWIARLNAVGAMARAKGLRLAYHAHDFEYRPIAGVRPIDLLQKGLDPALVDFEIDVYWTRRGGGDPMALFRRFPGRFPLAHFKDMTPGGAMADIGDGTIDYAAILAAAPRSGLRHAIVERDDGSDPMNTLRVGLARLRAIEARQAVSAPRP
ncbi:sugar phosphate isomerase/epimerase [Sphingomonas sp. ASV193]|uniref:sugar phosphate isomerase/epimerase family protein n=1 Tax=Sphingomonas sp. ASV193 TaxID=3144405 RepID=UPI0032E88B79